MNVSWNNEYDPNHLAQRLESSTIRSGSQSVSFGGFQIVEYEVLLYSMLKFPDSISEVAGRKIIQQAIFKAGEKGTITAKGLLTEINKLTSVYMNLPSERYVLVTSLSLPRFISLRKIRINGATIIFEPYLPARYQKPRAKITATAKHSLFADLPTDYLSVRVYISAKSTDEAPEMALSVLDLVRGIWNLFYNQRHFIRISYGKRSPVNEIVLGPLNTLHHPDGKLVAERWWYEPRYYGAVKLHKFSRDIDNMYKFLSDVRKMLARSNYHQNLEEAIIRYTRALDEQQDWDIAFLKLWSVLEFLTNTDDSYKVTIRHASFLFEDRDYYRQVLKHLKDYRNRFVHKSADNNEIETYMYQLKNCVEALLIFHLASSRRFMSLTKACEFLDLPSDRDTLKSRIQVMKYAERFLR